ncbi:hypothetical protein GJU41_11710 [Bacillus idriensis]|uniref:Uncharacterized protein n=1 Tax=Metabacillus idriensis TaxID=324768 RepID=A0A6I2M932_9BACI|nr:hypothetical protein [Metabacillus idriensis]MRX54638.1 hypothetical protein [Metabacillus idriensis]
MNKKISPKFTVICNDCGSKDVELYGSTTYEVHAHCNNCGISDVVE